MSHEFHARKHSSPTRRKTSGGKGMALHSGKHATHMPQLAILQQQVGNRALQRALEKGIAPSQLLMRQKEATAEPAKVEEAKILSGASWVEEFPTSTEVSDLDSSFSGKVAKFITALEQAGADVTINATRRPAERAYLMHWAWMIVKKGYNPRKIPAMKGVGIEWWHGDKQTSIDAAQEMVDGYEINKLKVPPALRSYHVIGKAIDMEISWSGDLTIKDARGVEVLIQSAPKDHTNRQLIAVGKSYQVIHFGVVDKDKVHWSVNGH